MTALAGADTLTLELTIAVTAGGGAPVAAPTVMGMPAGDVVADTVPVNG
jgi:hypothetical protein